MKIIDAHTHLDYITPNYQSDVVGAICCTTNESEWEQLKKLIAESVCVYGAFGVHPWFVNDVLDDFNKHLEFLLRLNPNYMIGEIGLDKHKPNMDKQIDVFIKQLNIAIKLRRTVFLHCIGAWDKILHVLKQYKQSELPIIVIHAFNENDDILKKLLQYKNLYFSLNKKSVYGVKCRIEQIPSEKILVESDGKKDVLLKDVITKLSDIKKDKNIYDVVYDNTSKVIKQWTD